MTQEQMNSKTTVLYINQILNNHFDSLWYRDADFREAAIAVKWENESDSQLELFNDRLNTLLLSVVSTLTTKVEFTTWDVFHWGGKPREFDEEGIKGVRMNRKVLASHEPMIDLSPEMTQKLAAKMLKTMIEAAFAGAPEDE